MEIKDKLKELGFEEGRVFSTKEISGHIFVVNGTNEIMFISDEYKNIVSELVKDFEVSVSVHSMLPNTMEVFMSKARNKEEREEFKKIAHKINVLNKHKNIAS